MIGRSDINSKDRGQHYAVVLLSSFLKLKNCVDSEMCVFYEIQRGYLNSF